MTAISEPVSAFREQCRICGNTDTMSFSAREMMFGLRDTFSYFECRACGCVQIAAYPPDMARFYPAGYYSFAPSPKQERSDKLPAQIKGEVKRVLLHSRAVRLWLHRRPAHQAWIARSPLPALYAALLPDPDARILDVGCGDGALVRELRDMGYRNALGADPFVAADVSYQGRLLVHKRDMGEMTGMFDCISMHHALEHMPNQLQVLQQARGLLAPGGMLVVRVPVAGGAAWRTYGADWVQLDPPRHFYVHSPNSLRHVAKQAGFAVRSLKHDSTGLQFWGSELYRQDIPLTDPRSPAKGSEAVVPASARAEYDRAAERLNAQGDGDQVVAVLMPA